MTTPARSLLALQAFQPLLFLDNPCRRVTTRCVWVRPGGALRPSAIESRYGWTVAGNGEATASFPSDSYVCSGARTLGSGRSVFVGGMQLKGVGRTAHAPAVGNPRVTDGRLRIDRAIRELHGAAVARRLSALPALPLEFMLLLPRAAGAAHDCVLLGRRGSPLRIAHLNLLRGASYAFPFYARLARWRRLVNRLDGRSGLGLELDHVHALFDRIVDNALVGLAESRAFGLTFANWHDNGDALARIFDSEDIEFHFGAPLDPARNPVAGPSAGDTPRAWFGRTLFSTPATVLADPYHCSLQFLNNAFVALEHLAAGVTYDERALDRRYPWRRLRAGYVTALAQALGRLCGVPAAAPALSRAARALARQVPLVPGDGATFSMRDYVEGLRDARAGRPIGAGVARRLGASLAAATRASAAELQARLDALDSARLMAERQRFVARASRIARVPERDRAAGYRALLLDVSRAGAIL